MRKLSRRSFIKALSGVALSYPIAQYMYHGNFIPSAKALSKLHHDETPTPSAGYNPCQPSPLKIAYITSQFPPSSTATYNAQEVRALEYMGLDVTVFSRSNTSGVDNRHDISDIKASIINLPERTGEYDNHFDQGLLIALNSYNDVTVGGILSAVLNRDNKLQYYTGQILEAVKDYHLLPSYQSAKQQLTTNLNGAQSRLMLGHHVMMFLQGLCLAHYVEHHDISVIYAQSFARPAQIADYASLILRSRRRIPWVTSGHNGDTIPLNDEEIRYRFAHADAITAESETARQAFKRLRVDISKVPVIYRGIDIDFFVPPSGSRTSNVIEIITIARATEKKGLNYLIDALTLIPAGLNVHVTHIGGGDLLDVLKRQATKLGVNDRITFLGGITSRAEILRHLQDSDIFISSSRKFMGIHNVSFG